ncbi:MAG: phospho-N-acetylmuramoyl-pentapeptide-transferase [Planctomycetota bacterium]
MLYYIFYTLLGDVFRPFRLFRFGTFRMAGAAITAFLIGVIFGPMMIRKFRSMRVTENTSKKDAEKLTELHGSKSNTPTMGGLIMLVGVLGATVLWGNFFDPVANPYLILALVLTAFLGLVGFADDYIKLTHVRRDGLTKRQKSLLQAVAAVAVTMAVFYSLQRSRPGPESVVYLADRHRDFISYCERVGDPELAGKSHPSVDRAVVDPNTGDPIPAPIDRHVLDNYEQIVDGYQKVVTRLHFPFFSNPKYYLPLGVVVFTLLGTVVMVGSSNAVNLTDGLDGLATSCALIVVAVYTVIAAVVGNYVMSGYLDVTYIPMVGELGVISAALLGAGLAFLWFNCYPAQVFMGDTGSLPIGGLVGYMAVVTRHEILLLLVGGLFVAEAVSVMLQVFYFKKTGGKRLFLCAPLHHHFEYKGWPEAKVTVRFIIVGIVLALASLATLKIR